MLPQKRNDPRQGNQADQQRKNGEKKEIGKLRGPARDVILSQGPADGPPQNPPRSANPGGHHASMRYSLRPSGLSCGILLPNFGIPIGRASLSGDSSICSARPAYFRNLSPTRAQAGLCIPKVACAGIRTLPVFSATDYNVRALMPDQPPTAESSSALRPAPSGHAPASTAGSLARTASLLAGRFRWVICALLFLGVTKNYMDRQVLGILKGPLQHAFGWSEIDYGNLVSFFQLAYAAGMLGMGALIDRVGTRIGYGISMVFWSTAAMAHAAAGSLAAFMAARSALGFFEAGVFPASIKCVAEWFPKKERALSTGIFNAGTSIGA